MSAAKNQKRQVSQICIVTVTGKDKVGIIARIANTMARANINIIDVSQRIMQEYFVMTMAIDITDAAVELEELQTRLNKIARQMDLTITLQHENIFKMMHRI